MREIQISNGAQLGNTYPAVYVCRRCGFQVVVEGVSVCSTCESMPEPQKRRWQRQRDAQVLLLALLIVAIMSGAFWYADVVMRGAK